MSVYVCTNKTSFVAKSQMFLCMLAFAHQGISSVFARKIFEKRSKSVFHTHIVPSVVLILAILKWFHKNQIDTDRIQQTSSIHLNCSFQPITHTHCLPTSEQIKRLKYTNEIMPSLDALAMLYMFLKYILSFF